MTAPVAIDALDAFELAEMLELLCDWIDGAPEVLGKSLARFLGAGYDIHALRADVARFAFLLGPSDRLFGPEQP